MLIVHRKGVLKKKPWRELGGADQGSDRRRPLRVRGDWRQRSSAQAAPFCAVCRVGGYVEKKKKELVVRYVNHVVCQALNLPLELHTRRAAKLCIIS